MSEGKQERGGNRAPSRGPCRYGRGEDARDGQILSWTLLQIESGWLPRFVTTAVRWKERRSGKCVWGSRFFIFLFLWGSATFLQLCCRLLLHKLMKHVPLILLGGKCWGKSSLRHTLVTLQVRMVLSNDPLTIKFPSGLAATAVTSSVWPSSVLKHSLRMMHHK